MAERIEMLRALMRAKGWAAVGVTGRKAAAGERRYLTAWAEMGFPAETVAMAYDQTLTHTGAMKWSYCNAILKRWHSEGKHSPQEVAAAQRRPRRKRTPSRSNAPNAPVPAAQMDNTPQSGQAHAQREREIPGNSNLYIAEMKNALELKLPAVRLSIPEYDWECQGFLVNEGPSCLIHNGDLYLTYSASATDERYAMGLLTLPRGADPLDAAAWRKSPVPVMVSEPQNSLYGPGHNSFTVDETGADLLVFHARPYPGFRGTALSDPNRHCFLRPVAYSGAEEPIFQAQ